MGEAIVKHIIWDVQDDLTIGYKYPETNIPTNSILQVGMGQVAVFVQYSEEGHATKVFTPGRYQLETDLPVGKEKGFFRRLFSKATGTNIYQCDIYFFNAEIRFPNLKWVTSNGPIDCGEVVYKYTDEEDSITAKVKIALRGFGTYGIHLTFDEFDDPDTIKTIVSQLMGAKSAITTDDVTRIAKDRIILNMSDAFGKVVREVGIDILNLGQYYSRLSEEMQNRVRPILKGYGIELDFFAISSMDMPEDVTKKIDEIREKAEAEQAKKVEARSLDYAERLRIKREAEERMSGGYMQEKQIEVMKAAASNEGMSGTFMGAGMGLGMGVGMGGLFGTGMNNMAQGAMGNAQQPNVFQQQPAQPVQQETCPQCGAVKQPNSNFCNSCGHAFGIKCPDCGAMLPTGSKFCNSCGKSLVAKCASCGAELAPGSRFCNSCGAKI